MTRDEWLAATLATAPPPSPAQIAVLRAVFRPVITDAAPARQREPHVPVPSAPHEGSMTNARS